MTVDRRTFVSAAGAAALLSACERGLINGGGAAATTRPDRFVLDSVHDRPGEAPVRSKFQNPRYLASLGFNGRVLNDHRYLQTSVTLDSFDRRIYPRGSAERAWVEARAAEVDAYIERCHRSGIGAYVFTDIIVVPKKVRELYGAEVVDEGGKYTFDRPVCVELHRAMFREIARRFPDLDGIVVRTGETYLHDVPYHEGNSPLKPHPEEASLADAQRAHTTLLRLLRQEICERSDIAVIYRTWAFGGIHTEPAVYRHVTDAVEPHPGLLFSIKHTAGDFHRNFGFNETLGIGAHRQIVEVQCQREYEGKGAHPNYIARGVIDGFIELQGAPGYNSLNDIRGTPQYAGVWTWSRGGGWKGPYIENELWCALNAFVVAKWAQEPERSEDDIFNEFCTEQLSLEAAGGQAFRELNLLTEAGVLLGRSSRLAPVNPFWIRDEFMGGIVAPEIAAGANAEQWGILNGTFAGIVDHGLVDAVLAEKARAVDIWRRIEALAAEVDAPDRGEQRHIELSCTYGRIKYAVIEAAWTVMLLGLGSEHGLPVDRQRAQAAYADYRALWSEWRRLAAANAQVATLYRPYSFVFEGPDYHRAHGMESSVERYARQLLGRAEDGEARLAPSQTPA